MGMEYTSGIQAAEEEDELEEDELQKGECEEMHSLIPSKHSINMPMSECTEMFVS